MCIASVFIAFFSYQTHWFTKICTSGLQRFLLRPFAWYPQACGRGVPFSLPACQSRWDAARAAAAVVDNWLQPAPPATSLQGRRRQADQLGKDRLVKLQQCRTNKMVADALTKNLPVPAINCGVQKGRARVCTPHKSSVLSPP